MEPTKKDITPADEWLSSLNATCNRLSNQYLSLLKSASSVSSLLQNVDEITPSATSITSSNGIADSSLTNATGTIVAATTTSSSSINATAAIAGGVGSSTTATSATIGGSSSNVTQHDPRGTSFLFSKIVCTA